MSSSTPSPRGPGYGLLALVWVLLALAAGGAAAADPAGLCRSVPCRPAKKIKLRVEEGQVLKTKAPRTPYVHEGAVQIIPGETLYIEAEIDGDRLINLRRVKRPQRPKVTLELRLQQPGKARADLGMMLTIGNPFKRALRYKASFLPAGADDPASATPKPTSTCPIAPRMKSHESWPHPILRLYLSDFILVDTEGPCA